MGLGLGLVRRAVRHDRQAVQRRLTVEEHHVAVTHVPLHHVAHLVRGRGRVGARVGARVSGEWPGSVTLVHVHADVPLHHVAYRVYAYAYAYVYMHMCMHIYAHLELGRGSAAVAKLEGALVAVAALDVVGAGPRLGPVEHELPQLREVKTTLLPHYLTTLLPYYLTALLPARGCGRRHMPF